MVPRFASSTRISIAPPRYRVSAMDAPDAAVELPRSDELLIVGRSQWAGREGAIAARNPHRFALVLERDADDLRPSIERANDLTVGEYLVVAAGLLWPTSQGNHGKPVLSDDAVDDGSSRK
jgi:hypothetical protein